MKLSEFDFYLPESLIAQHPPAQRGESRLLVCQPDFHIEKFSAVADHLRPHDLLLLNNTKVLKARLQGTKQSGGKIEVMLERLLTDNRFTAMIRASHAPKPGSDVLLADQVRARILSRNGMMYELQVTDDTNLLELLEQHGSLPLPPYITHNATASDDERYQTVFAKQPGAVAAPTAGLHFTETLLDDIAKKGTCIQTLTLHVGAGTFLPVKTDNVNEHVMHSERFRIEGAVIRNLIRTKKNGGSIAAVGTTSLRAIEAWALETGIDLNSTEGLEQAAQYEDTGYEGDTCIFIKPGFQFRVVDKLITNFHLPKSTLLMLVSAFAGKEAIFAAYAHAIENHMRFFSYGDAMWLTR